MWAGGPRFKPSFGLSGGNNQNLGGKFPTLTIPKKSNHCLADRLHRRRIHAPHARADLRLRHRGRLVVHHLRYAAQSCLSARLHSHAKQRRGMNLLGQRQHRYGGMRVKRVRLQNRRLPRLAIVSPRRQSSPDRLALSPVSTADWRSAAQPMPPARPVPARPDSRSLGPGPAPDSSGSPPADFLEQFAQ